MSHSFDSTLLQRMGFKDPDRGTPAHDRACIEIATKPHLLTEALGMSAIEHRGHHADLEVPLQKGDGKYASTVGFIDAMISLSVGHESNDWWQVGGSWGAGEYRHQQVDRCAVWKERIEEHQEWSAFQGASGGFITRQRRIGSCACSRADFHGPNTRFWEPVSLLVEVKSAIDNVGDLLRQMNLYREYKKEHESRRVRSRVAQYVVWSLRASDIELADLLDGQGYKLVVGESISKLAVKL